MRIAVFCSASPDTTREMKDDARALGAMIGRGGHELVYGGVALGLMETVAAAVKDNGGKVTGVVPHSRASMASRLCDTTIGVDGLHLRKQTMEELADAFVALSGGFGTLDEIVATWASLSFNGVDKPVVVVDRDRLYGPLRQQIARMTESGLLRPEVASKLKFVSSVGDACDAVGISHNR